MAPRIIPSHRDYPGLVAIPLGDGRELVAVGDTEAGLAVLLAAVKERDGWNDDA